MRQPVAHGVVPRSSSRRSRSAGRGKAPSRAIRAQEFPESDRSPTCSKHCGAGHDAYNAWVANGFADYRLQVAGWSGAPLFTLPELRALPARTHHAARLRRGLERDRQVEGHDAGGLLELVKPKPSALRDVLRGPDGGRRHRPPTKASTWRTYHAQTILAYDMNDAALPVPNGAPPIRLRVERQLGYKHAKFITSIELVSSFAHIAGRKGGHWEDQGISGGRRPIDRRRALRDFDLNRLQ
jgi:DMSO/TMAO reductase YedYZ molybdopterin-dependent catalytic subunit